ncbi:MAG: alpha/beta hydrolase [Alphaproteobacteria bacterium]|nr:alpha/beta hydrolase [Alphaproteobacteria bacterium]
MPAYVEKTLKTRDGPNLYYRDYANSAARSTPVLCLSGTTQNSRIYDELAPHLQRQRRVLCMDWRGHGRSDYDPDWRHYSYFEDRDDVLDLLASETLAKVIVIGTSLGGIVTMHIAPHRPDVLAGAIMNDVGPVIGAAGRQRLHDNMGLPMVFDSFAAAMQANKERNGKGVTLSDAEWLERTRRTFKEQADGKVVPDMDPMYGRVFRERSRPPDWWSNWEAMKAIPVLAVRGGVSDILDEPTLAEMKRRKPDLVTVVVPGRGHCPHLDEPEALRAIDGFLARLP